MKGPCKNILSQVFFLFSFLILQPHIVSNHANTVKRLVIDLSLHECWPVGGVSFNPRRCGLTPARSMSERPIPKRSPAAVRPVPHTQPHRHRAPRSIRTCDLGGWRGGGLRGATTTSGQGSNRNSGTGGIIRPARSPTPPATRFERGHGTTSGQREGARSDCHLNRQGAGAHNDSTEHDAVTQTLTQTHRIPVPPSPLSSAALHPVSVRRLPGLARALPLFALSGHVQPAASLSKHQP